MTHTILGVISDTHIPDRARRLNSRVLPVFREAEPAAILHAGDVSVPSVLEQLREIAPVFATRGNRDWVALRDLPQSTRLTYDGVTVGIMHGHGNVWNYMLDRVRYMVGGYRLGLFQPRLQATFPEARVIVFGHTHRPLNLWVDGQLLFNPGSPHVPDGSKKAPSVGFLHIHTGGQVEGEIVWLK